MDLLRTASPQIGWKLLRAFSGYSISLSVGKILGSDLHVTGRWDLARVEAGLLEDRRLCILHFSSLIFWVMLFILREIFDRPLPCYMEKHSSGAVCWVYSGLDFLCPVLTYQRKKKSWLGTLLCFRFCSCSIPTPFR
ncbi:hypothetical protein MPH_07903 [Macrophomina phaseolina MS6]|uniref:Uncharacterized protein n=1 Tax=Macrophomina phaseolina (strain MS6) TaxID=1126212 RepID=K2RK30_MACPH|nr:hypothetical protein MPH_07903 [Macrophomina phaseolina MS6]